MNTLRVRTARSADIPVLARLLGVLFAQESELEPDLEKQIRGLTMLISEPSSGFVLVAEEDGDTIGMLSVLVTVSTALGSHVGTLEDVIVVADRRNCGAGAALMNAAFTESELRGLARLTLLTDAENLGAQRFYERLGFVRSAMRVFRKQCVSAPTM